jgi:hypothetical protein
MDGKSNGISAESVGGAQKWYIAVLMEGGGQMAVYLIRRVSEAVSLGKHKGERFDRVIPGTLKTPM